MAKQKLKPCPFCRATSAESYMENAKGGFDAFVRCMKCKARGPTHFVATPLAVDDDMEAKFADGCSSAWNDRSEDA